MLKLAFSPYCAMSRCVVQCPGALRDVKVYYIMFRCVGKVPRHRNLYKSELFRHLNNKKNKNKTTKPVQTVKRPPFGRGLIIC